MQSRRDSEQAESTRKVATLETHLASTRQQKKAAEEANVALLVEAEHKAGAEALAAAAMQVNPQCISRTLLKPLLGFKEAIEIPVAF